MVDCDLAQKSVDLAKKLKFMLVMGWFAYCKVWACHTCHIWLCKRQCIKIKENVVVLWCHHQASMIAARFISSWIPVNLYLPHSDGSHKLSHSKPKLLNYIYIKKEENFKNVCKDFIESFYFFLNVSSLHFLQNANAWVGNDAEC